jgi:hypothetical protein
VNNPPLTPTLPYPLRPFPTQTDKTKRPKLTHPSNQLTKALSLALIPLTFTTAATTTTPSAENPNLNANIAKTKTLTLTAYEFPFCLASDSDLLQNFFVSRPTETNLTVSNPPVFSRPNGECVAIKASKGLVHSFFYTFYGDDDDEGNENGEMGRRDSGSSESCELVTFEEEGCGGTGTRYDLGGASPSSRSKCFSRPDRFVKALLKSARLVCE